MNRKFFVSILYWKYGFTLIWHSCATCIRGLKQWGEQQRGEPVNIRESHNHAPTHRQLQENGLHPGSMYSASRSHSHRHSSWVWHSSERHLIDGQGTRRRIKLKPKEVARRTQLASYHLVFQYTMTPRRCSPYVLNILYACQHVQCCIHFCTWWGCKAETAVVQ